MANLSPKDPILKNSVPADAGEDNKYFMVVDDNQGDRTLLRMALEENQIQEAYRFAGNGLELIEFLEQRKPTLLYPGSPLPCLILLDLFMPRVDGHEALRIIKTDRDLRKIPVIILTSSHTLDDIAQSYHDGANSFLSKPMEYKKLVDLLGLVKRYWLEEARLPA